VLESIKILDIPEITVIPGITKLSCSKFPPIIGKVILLDIPVKVFYNIEMVRYYC
jgi:hypothetical protein